MTAIEQLLYGERGIHGVSEFAISSDGVRLQLLPWEGPQVQTVAVFSEAKLLSVWSNTDDLPNLDLPWDVIGFDCQELGNGRWQFVMNCGAIEFCFDSAWPVVSRTEA